MIGRTQDGKPIIVLAERTSSRARGCLSEHAHVGTCYPGDVLRHVAEADALMVRTYMRVDESLSEKARRPMAVGRAGVGLEDINVRACRRCGIAVVYAPGASTTSVVDYTVGLQDRPQQYPAQEGAH